MLRRRELMAKQQGSSLLPTGYTAVKYVSCNQAKSKYKAGIATGVLSNNVFGVKVSFCWTDDQNATAAFLLFTGKSGDGQNVTTPFWYVAYTVSTYNIKFANGCIVNNHTVVHNDDYVTISFDISKTKSGYFNFGCWQDHQWSPNWKLYELILYGESGEELFHGIPCLNESNVPGCYDTVSKTFKGSIVGTFGYELFDGTIVNPT